jgi:phospholipid-binding lipoprotein MlaA
MLGVLLGLTGCATLEGPEYAMYDTAERANRKSYEITDAIDKAVLVPVARGYERVIPDFVRTGVTNFFANLRGLNSAVNGYLQGKPSSGTIELVRFLMNSTLGLAGLVDVAAIAGLRQQDEDFGQTLAVWGYTRSRYVYVPFFGPSTIRDLPDLVIRGFFPRVILGSDYDIAVASLDVLNTRANTLGATDARDAGAIDPYAFTRDAYFQLRKFNAYDGDPPMDEFDEFFDDEWEDEDSAFGDSAAE